VGAIIETHHDKNGINFPESIAPYRVMLINLIIDDSASVNAADKLYEMLNVAGVEVLYDDRDKRAGEKFATSDLLGIPWKLVVGPRDVAAGVVEMTRRGSSEKNYISLDDMAGVIAQLSSVL
jgi:prolyl-tRNA synthetase